MIFKTFQILWHDQLPVLSCEFYGNDCLVTSGADHEIKVWAVGYQKDNDLSISYKGSITGHSRAVNCVRLHGDRLASAGDGGEVMVWAPPSDLDSKSNVHEWKVNQLLRGHADDVIDLAWSLDGTGIVTTSIDNTVIVWDAVKGKRKKCFSGHRHYVQGVTWDPLGQHVLTLSTDRTMRVHKCKSAKKNSGANITDIQTSSDFIQTASVYKRPLSPTEIASRSPEALQSAAAKSSKPSHHEDGREIESVNAKTSTFIFQDESLNTFFRRLEFSPDGSFVVAPAATLGPVSPAPQCAILPQALYTVTAENQLVVPVLDYLSCQMSGFSCM